MAAPVLRPLSTGEILDVSFGLYRRLFTPLVLIQVICSSLPFAIAMYAAALGPTSEGLGVYGISYLLSFLLGALASGATAIVISENYLGHAIGAGEGLRRALPRLPSLIGVSLLIALVVGAAMLPFAIAFAATAAGLGFGQPGLALALGVVALASLLLPILTFSGFAVSTPSLVIEQLRSPTRAMGRSWSLTRGSRFRIVGLLFVFFVLLAVPFLGFTLVSEIVIGSESATGRVVSSVIASLLSFVLAPILYCILTLTYYDLRVRKEAFDLEVLATQLGAVPA
jgi:multisubunit Na+/H+ antiporter MnhB subunit